MDISKFQTDSPGRLTKIETSWGSDHAFIPNPLPPHWNFPNDLWPLLAEAKQQLGILEGLGRNLPNPAILLRPLSDREAIRSSSLEGTYATPKELLLFELQPRESTSEHDKTNDQIEVFNYRRALTHGTSSPLPLSLRLIKELHQILLSKVRGRDRSPGEFRRIQVGIGSQGRFIPPPPDVLMECLDPLEKYLHIENSKYDPLVDCFLSHYQFETIHPFIDGNGRVGRLLLAISLYQRCCLSKPWLYMSEYFDKNRDDYFNHLFHVSAHNDWEGWIRFCLQGTVIQAKETTERCSRLLEVRERFTAQIAEVGGSTRLNQIVEDIFHSPFVRIADLPKRLGVTYPTAKSDVDRLIQADILHELPDVWPKTLYAPEVFSIAYEELNDTTHEPP